ncbi:hypothetical protein HIM_05794 [Hirsutella minnesotensis 3608]|uniref:C2H2-type domain-containing protein n=1 Tax=Hirsutella minnesotensis 3608 TaxID=1043627 RepID=A0A0F7ZP50_9HYPO|nr:hypothetical protein HIM_05794 [Hirsutella minnesotensis 3608]
MPYNTFFECGTCDKAFPTGCRARDQHCRSTGHSIPAHECQTCQRWFYSQSACEQHMRDVNHWSIECSVCNQTFPSQEQCTTHERDVHMYCADCNRHFQSDNNLKMHLNSRVHRGQNIDCPFCNRSYTSATGLTHHLELGSCAGAPDLNRDELYRLVRSRDPQGIVSKNLIGWTGSSFFDIVDASEAWNGYGYECYFCHRSFKNSGALNQHLSSPIHQQDLYHCPNPACRNDFRSLAGIVNHLESGSCNFIRFERVQTSVQNIISSNRLIAF